MTWSSRRAPSEESKLMTNQKLTAAIGVAIVAALTAVSSQAWTDPHHTTYVTFDRAVSLPDVELKAGSYVFELVVPGFDQSLVQVMSRDRRTVYAKQFTRTVQRPAGRADIHGITF